MRAAFPPGKDLDRPPGRDFPTRPPYLSSELPKRDSQNPPTYLALPGGAAEKKCKNLPAMHCEHPSDPSRPDRSAQHVDPAQDARGGPSKECSLEAGRQSTPVAIPVFNLPRSRSRETLGAMACFLVKEGCPSSTEVPWSGSAVVVRSGVVADAVQPDQANP